VSTRVSHSGSFEYAHLHLLDLLTERGTVTGTVLSGDSDLLCAYIAINNCPIGMGEGSVRLVILAVVWVGRG
jgi:hypothetical protein